MNPGQVAIDLNKEVAFVIDSEKMIFRSTFGAAYVCFKTLYSLTEAENVIMNENSLLKTIKQTNIIKYSATPSS